ncbi:MAG: S8 family serine peptidase, partial [Gammaproteobacteria bacterium]|nr:S8 family serine peptidase [Gammaproteobacteria bacterium]
NLYQEYQEAKGKGVADKDFRSTNKALRVTRATIGLDAVATDGAALARSLKAMGATNVRNQGPLVSARVPVSALGKLAADSALRYARAPLATTEALPDKAVSQGDVSLRADLARDEYDVDGTGITVGVLSDSFACNPPAFQPGAPTSTKDEDVSNDELPSNINIVKDGPCPDGTDEGRAMAQLIHDVAPASSIAFHTAFESEFDFAEGIIRLRDAGAAVIVDDVRYFAEPFFSDGMIAQAVDIVTDGGAGVPYFSSAGNSARESYEDVYRPVNFAVNAGVNLNGGAAVVRRFHDFDPGPGVSILQPVVVVPDGGAGVIVFSFQWDQPHMTATTYARIKAQQDPALAVGATTDLDIVVFDYKGHVVRRCPPGVSKGITCQIAGDRNVGGDAVDLSLIYYAGPPKRPQVFYIGFVYSGGDASAAAVNRVKYTWSEAQGSFGILQFATNSPTSYGHSNAAGNIAVGAASWYATVPFSTSGLVPPNDKDSANPIVLSPCAPACLNDFSSAGGIPILFDKFGVRLPAPEVRLVPSVTGPDGGNTSFFFSDSSYDDDDADGKNSPFSTFVSATLDQPGDEYPNFFGTSASAPHVAAVAALMLEKNSALTQSEVRQILEDSAESRPISKRFTSARPIVTTPIVSDGYNHDAGVGLVDAVLAVQASEPD